MIRTVGLTKTFSRMDAVCDLDLDVPAGSVVGLIGPNGAGKTTIMKLLLGLTKPTSGTGLVMDHDIVMESEAVRAVTAYVPDDKSVYPGMTVGQFLRFYLDFFPDASIAHAHTHLRRWRIDPGVKTQNLSRGSRLKVLFAAVLARRAPVLLLDEPTEGLDPAASEDVLHEIITRSEDTTTLFATHRLEDVERVCDRVAILDRGTVVLNANLDDLRMQWRRVVLRNTVESPATLLRGVVTGTAAGAVTVTIPRFDDERLSHSALAGAIVDVQPMNLREIYLAATGPLRGFDPDDDLIESNYDLLGVL